MNWQDFCSALALMMIFEGLSPFMMPARIRSIAESVLTMSDRIIRVIGLLSMMMGLALLFWVRA